MPYPQLTFYQSVTHWAGIEMFFVAHPYYDDARALISTLHSASAWAWRSGQRGGWRGPRSRQQAETAGRSRRPPRAPQARARRLERRVRRPARARQACVRRSGRRVRLPARLLAGDVHCRLLVLVGQRGAVGRICVARGLRRQLARLQQRAVPLQRELVVQVEPARAPPPCVRSCGRVQSPPLCSLSVAARPAHVGSDSAPSCARS